MSRTLFLDVMAKHYQADDLLEQGVMAELAGEPKPELFRKALGLFEDTAAAMKDLDAKLDALIAIHKRGTEVPAFAQSVKRILGENVQMARVSLTSSRFANVARAPAPARRPPPPSNLLELMQAQREDLGLLRKQLDDTIEAFKAVIPLAEKHQFVPMMLSGRAGFSSRVQQSVDLLGEFSRFYSRGCMATIEATMQAYPAGFAWLPKVPDDLGPTPKPNRQPAAEAEPKTPAEPTRPAQPTAEQTPDTPAKTKKGCQATGGGGGSLLAVMAALAVIAVRRRRRV